MSTNGETADLMVREGIQITESALKLAGLGAKNLAALLIALANDNQKLAGKTNLKRLIHDGEELTIFSVKQEDLKGFQMEAKRYGVLFYPIVNKVEKTGTVEIMAKARDAKQINRIFERMGYPAPVKEDTAAKKENARAPSENSSKERGTGARASTEPATEKADARPSVRSRLMALQAAAERDGTAPTKDTVREAIQKAKETRAKDGYLLDDTPQTVKVKSNEVVTVEFRNQPKGNLIIVKQDSVTKEPLEGVQFKITYADGSYVDAAGGTLSSTGLYWTDKAGKISISGISGTIVATEVKSIPGYTIDENSRTQTVVVNPNDTQTLYFYNTPVGGLQIIKSDKDSGKRISGVKFEIRKMNGEIIGTYTTDSDGVIYLPEAESGWYTVTELEAASGYLLDTTPHRIEVKDGQTATLEIINHKSSRILLHKVDKATGKGIYGAVFLLYDSNRNPIGEYVTDQDGYIYADEGLADGRYYLREIKAAPGYVLDPELKTIYVRYGSTTEIEWSNTAECGQIQIIKKSADDNATNGLPAGTLLEGAVFEIYDKAGNVVDTIKSDRNGRAVSKTLPLSRYTIREIKAPANYSINPTVMTAYLEFNGQIVTFEVQNTSVSTGVSIKKTGPVQAVPGQPIRYVFSQIKNSSNVALDSFYWRDQLPAQVTLSKIVTGSYNQPLSYKVVYKTNLSGDYRTLADNLSTSKVYVLDARPAALGLAANERVTEVMFVFGNVKAGFAQVETPYIYAAARSGLANNSGIVNVADVGGLYNGQWIQAVSRWLTTVYTKTTVKLPKTGY